MLWQMAAAAAIGSLFYVKKILLWTKNLLSTNSPMQAGFLFATLFAFLATALTVVVFHNHALPRFTDVFLIGIVLTAYLFRWEPSVYLLGISLLVSAWVLPPYGSFRVAGFVEWYRMGSFTLVSVLLVYLLSRGKARKAAEQSQPSYPMHHRAIAGAD
jgi:K+-sensing histidine kinase KdpD